MLHFPSVKFALHHVYYDSRADFFLHFFYPCQRFRMCICQRAEFLFSFFFLDSGAPGGQRWRGGAGRRKRGFGRKEGEEKESAEGRERERESCSKVRGHVNLGKM